MNRKAVISLLLTICLVAPLKAQNSTPRTLLPAKISDLLAGEASGERAMNHIIEMGAYNHNRPDSEYSGNFFETDYVAGKLKEYGLEDVRTDYYEGGEYWDGISGELWETSPGLNKLADYGDLTAMVAQGSANTDIKAELVWVGEGSAEEVAAAGVKGKIAVSSGNPRMVHANAVSAGAVGIVSFNSPRPLKVPEAIPVTGISGRGSADEKTTFGFMLPPREGELLRQRLERGEKIMVHARVEAQTVNYKLEVTSCRIRGTDPEAGEVILSAHLFEGYVKQGANDNISGSAAILEVARMLHSMIEEGTIERPKRGIRFIWVPEFSGTIPWVKENMALMERTLCNINLDMVGLNLAESQSFLCMQRTTYGNPHYINDVMENYYDYVGITNREGLAISGRGGFTKRIVAPSGTDDPFYYSVDDHYGASDHEVFNDPAVGVPGIMMITWPDLYYHTSLDRADKCDPTQLKRVCYIASAAAYTIASADDAMAALIAGEVTGNASGRIGKQYTRATTLLASAGTQVEFETAYNRGYAFIEAAAINEKATLASTLELTEGGMPALLEKDLNSIAKISEALLLSFDAYTESLASAKGFRMPTLLRTNATTIVPVRTSKVKEAGYGVARIIQSSAGEYSEEFPVKARVDYNELLRLCNGINSAADIGKLMNAQSESGNIDSQSLMNALRVMKETGYVTF